MAHDEVAEHYAPDGRWGGRLTSRELPDDPSVDDLPIEAREELARHWLARGGSERRVGDSFAVIRDALAEFGGAEPLVALATRAIDDELRHAELSRVVASRYAGRELSPPERLPHSVPQHPEAAPELRRTLWIIGQCALNETLACSVLEASMAATRAPLARAALRELLSDEVDHARIGWGHLASLDATTRAAVEPWIVGLVRSNVRKWRTTEREVPSDPRLVEHGALTNELLEGALQAALRDVIIPGFAQVGLPVERLTRWLVGGAPT